MTKTMVTSQGNNEALLQEAWLLLYSLWILEKQRARLPWSQGHQAKLRQYQLIQQIQLRKLANWSSEWRYLSPSLMS